MRIGIFAEDLAPSLGGVHTFTVEVARALGHVPSRGHELILYTRGAGLDGTNLGALPVVRVEGPARPRPARRIAEGLRVIAELGGSSRAGRVRTAWHGQLARDGVELLWSLGPQVPILDVPFAVTVWDVTHRRHPWFPEFSSDGEYGHRERTLSASLPRAMRVIVGTSDVADEVRRFYAIPPERIRIIRCPTPAFALVAAGADPRGDSAVLARLHVVEPFVLYPAQLLPHKNHRTLLEALRRLADDGLPLDVAFAGADDGQGEALRMLAQTLGISTRVHFLGLVEQSDLVALYRRATVTAYPCLVGPENLPSLEAGALGCPVVAGRVESIEEQLGDAALYVDPLDAGSIADGIGRVVRDATLRARLVERGRARAHAFTAEDFAEHGLDVLDEMARIRSRWS